MFRERFSSEGEVADEASNEIRKKNLAASPATCAYADIAQCTEPRNGYGQNHVSRTAQKRHMTTQEAPRTVQEARTQGRIVRMSLAVRPGPFAEPCPEVVRRNLPHLKTKRPDWRLTKSPLGFDFGGLEARAGPLDVS